MSLQSQVLDLVTQYHDDMISTRRYLHQHPEVSYKEFETTKFIKSELDKLGIPYESPLETGCVGILKGGKQ
ncbi:MAG: amidohydrolase, partial [Balneolaceae bacterium]